MKILLVLFAAFVVFAGCKDEPEIIALDSGLLYADDSLGTGREAKEGDLVALHFTAWSITDSSDLYSNWENDTSKMSSNIGSSKMYQQPVKFKLGTGQFIPGVDEGIVGMKIGGKRTLIVPSGPAGVGPVPPNNKFKVVIELIDAKESVEVKQWEADSTKAVATSSGLKYIMLNEGEGESPDSGDVVSVHYSGFLPDGTMFDSSVERGEPFVFTIGRGQVIKGWDEGIALLKEGSKAKLIIPSTLGYGERGSGPIPPNSNLIFDVELVDVK
ncbi:MAG: FKBP-type peptidyl-prolyl cis-trans isomerase [Ignavibacteriaceae bacterium]